MKRKTKLVQDFHREAEERLDGMEDAAKNPSPATTEECVYLIRYPYATSDVDVSRDEYLKEMCSVGIDATEPADFKRRGVRGRVEKQQPSTRTLRAAQGDGQAGLVGKELDAAIAEQVMGFDEVEHIGDLLYYHNAEMDRLSETGGRWRSPVPMYHSDIAAAMEVEDRIAELGLQTRYVLELGKIVDPREFRSDKVALLWWALVHATAEQRCRAALAAVVQNN